MTYRLVDGILQLELARDQNKFQQERNKNAAQPNDSSARIGGSGCMAIHRRDIL